MGMAVGYMLSLATDPPQCTHTIGSATARFVAVATRFVAIATRFLLYLLHTAILDQGGCYLVHSPSYILALFIRIPVCVCENDVGKVDMWHLYTHVRHVYVWRITVCTPFVLSCNKATKKMPGIDITVSCRTRQRFCGWRNKISVRVSVSVNTENRLKWLVSH
jgi:hypothetical protein